MAKKWATSTVLLSTILALVVGAFSGVVAYHFISTRGGPTHGWQVDVQKWLENAQGSSINIVAVSSDPEPTGVICDLAVKIEPNGNGIVYIAIDPMLVGFDFQDASRKAVKVACSNTGFPLDVDGVGIAQSDVFFLVSVPSSEQITVQSIDGPSAGAATTIALIAALENKRIKEGYIITGTVEEDSSIGPVGGIFYKAEAAKNAGSSHFLVPSGQSVATMYQQVVRQIGRFQWITYEPISIDLNQYAQEHGWNLEIHEVSTIEEAVGMMLE